MNVSVKAVFTSIVYQEQLSSILYLILKMWNPVPNQCQSFKKDCLAQNERDNILDNYFSPRNA